MPFKLKVFVWNVSNGDWDEGLISTAKYIQRAAPQIALLGPILKDQVAPLSVKTGLPFWRYWGTDSGMSVLAAYPLGPVTATQVADFAPPDHLVQTTASILGIQHHIFSNHFNHTNPCLRLADARRQNAIVSTLPTNTPVVMGGDLNARPRSPAIKVLNETFTEAWLDAAEYNCGDNFRRIDYIFFRGRYRIASYDFNCNWDLGPEGGPTDHPFVVAELEPLYLQYDWRFCHRCNGLFRADGAASAGVCPAGSGGHPRGASDYALVMDSPVSLGQHDWRWCHKCSGLFWAGGATSAGACPAGAGHARGNSSDYALPMNLPAGPKEQNDWRWCHKCGGLFWAGGTASAGACPAGAAHTRGTSDYCVVIL